MSTATTTSTCGARRIAWPARAVLVARFADYLELTKPRIALMALATVAVGYALGASGRVDVIGLLHALAGIALVAAGSSALNQWAERETDALMPRTSTRPLPAGRLLPGEVLLFGAASGGAGCLYLCLQTNLLTGMLAAATLGLYVLVYTPLKRVTTLSTAIGAVPGALPPVLGWTAATGHLDSAALVLFGILFLWQFPHFLAIAWLYREQYCRAGLKMLPVAARARRATGALCVAYAVVLIPVSLLPARHALAGEGYLLSALVLGIGYVASACRFLWNESPESARGLVWTSLMYLPLLLLTMTWDHFALLR